MTCLTRRYLVLEEYEVPFENLQTVYFFEIDNGEDIDLDDLDPVLSKSLGLSSLDGYRIRDNRDHVSHGADSMLQLILVSVAGRGAYDFIKIISKFALTRIKEKIYGSKDKDEIVDLVKDKVHLHFKVYEPLVEVSDVNNGDEEYFVFKFGSVNFKVKVNKEGYFIKISKIR